jgi:hypothetical protein
MFIFVIIATGVFSSFSRHKLFKDKFAWRSQYVLSLDYKRPKSELNSPVAPTCRNVIDVTSNCERGNSGECVGCAWSNIIASHMRCRGAKRKLMVRNFCFWLPYIALCADTYCVWSYEISETFWSGVWFSHKKDLKMGCKNQNWKHRPVINVTCLFGQLTAESRTEARFCYLEHCWSLSPPRPVGIFTKYRWKKINLMSDEIKR